MEIGIPETNLRRITIIVIFRHANGIDDAVPHLYVLFLMFITSFLTFSFLQRQCSKIGINSKSDFTLVIKSSWESLKSIFFSCLHKNFTKENLN